MADNAISDNEVLFLKCLRDDLEAIVESMVSPDNPPQEYEKLTIHQLNAILDSFFTKWSYHDEDSPFLLLMQN
jgi:hypothetical protein